MDQGWAAIIGATIGAVATLAGGWLTNWLQTKRAASLADKRRDTLKRMLNGDKYIWRSIKVLAASIGANEETTAELLLEVDARASLTNNESWALVARAPWPSDM